MPPRSSPSITSTTKRAKCLSGSHSSTDGGRRNAVRRSTSRKLLIAIKPPFGANQWRDSSENQRRWVKSDRLLEQSFDLVIVDEAHHLRDRASQSYKLVDSLTKRFLLLLSATPVQNNLIELYNLLTLLKPGIFKTQKEFRSAYMTAGKPLQPANPERLRDLMRDAMIRNTRAVVALKLLRRHASTRYVDPTPEEQAAYLELAA